MSQPTAAAAPSSPTAGRLSGTRVLVVGGSSGIGLATALAAQAAGAEVIVASRNPDRAASALPGVRSVTIDVTDDASVESVFDGVGSLHHLVCTAASGFPPGLFSAPADDVRQLMESKFWGQYRCARAAAARLAPEGSIVLTSGIRSRRPQRGAGAFTVVNMAVEGMTRALALEIAPLRVNAVAPGSVDTPVFDALAPDVRARRLEGAARQTTVGRVGAAAEIAEVILMCLTNPFLSGSVIDVDGGAMLA
jgi:NAD(P)-dependent dehydrogenase (short-subunit alcohol dehydrogenase family)